MIIDPGKAPEIKVISYKHTVMKALEDVLENDVVLLNSYYGNFRYAVSYSTVDYKGPINTLVELNHLDLQGRVVVLGADTYTLSDDDIDFFNELLQEELILLH